MEKKQKYPPKSDCWAYRNGECGVLLKTFCTEKKKCAFFKTKSRHEASLRKSEERLRVIGYKNKY